MASVYELFPGEIVIDLATMRIGRVSMRDLLKMTVTVKFETAESGISYNVFSHERTPGVFFRSVVRLQHWNG